MSKAIALLDSAIAELEIRLNLQPGAPIGTTFDKQLQRTKNNDAPAKKEKQNQQPKPEKQSKGGASTAAAATDDLPDICKLEFKVGVITKVWVHEKADKLYCEEIDVGEDEPRQIASGLRHHFTLEQMLGQRVLVVSNLKAKNLVGFKSHGMVLCASKPTVADEEMVEFVEPPMDAKIGEIVHFNGLPEPQPVSPNQCEKMKLFQKCMDHMQSTSECQAAWKDHVFMTSGGPCITKSIANGALR